MTGIEKWDRRFLDVARLVSTWSKDPSTKCGAVIVRPDRSIVSTGYNGFPRGIHDRHEHLHDRSHKYPRVIHAEVNAVLQARTDLRGCSIYTWPPGLAPSCDRCATTIIQSGITRVVWGWHDADYSQRWSPDIALQLFAEAGVDLVSYNLGDGNDFTG